MLSPNYSYDKRRLEAFIDAIIAIILTILVLELRVPETEHSNELNTRQQAASLLPSFVSYIGSFGMFIDKFGIKWMINTRKNKQLLYFVTKSGN